MSIPSYNEFIHMNKKYKKFETSLSAKEIYDYLSIADNIDKMISANNNGKPALYGVQKYLEENFAGLNDFNFDESFVKQCVGSMVRDILAPIGYKPLLQRDLPKYESSYFKSAMHYSFDPTMATCRLVRKVEIEEIR